MKIFYQLLLTLGLLAFLVGAVTVFAGKTFLISSEGYWRGAMGFWMLLVATRMVYPEKK